MHTLNIMSGLVGRDSRNYRISIPNEVVSPVVVLGFSAKVETVNRLNVSDVLHRWSRHFEGYGLKIKLFRCVCEGGE
jgi:hypothetical protein